MLLIINLPEVLFSARYGEQQGHGIWVRSVHGLLRNLVAALASLATERVRDMI